MRASPAGICGGAAAIAGGWTQPVAISNRPPNPDRRFGLMRRIVVRNAAVIYDDRRTDRRWEADRVDASIDRNPQGLAGDVSFALPFDRHQPELHANYRYASEGRTVDLSVQI